MSFIDNLIDGPFIEKSEFDELISESLKKDLLRFRKDDLMPTATGWVHIFKSLYDGREVKFPKETRFEFLQFEYRDIEHTLVHFLCRYALEVKQKDQEKIDAYYNEKNSLNKRFIGIQAVFAFDETYRIWKNYGQNKNLLSFAKEVTRLKQKQEE